jgi:protein TonB
MNSTPPPKPQKPANAADRARAFLLWAFLISIVSHFIVGPLVIHFKPPKKQEEKEQVVTVAKKTKIVVPTPPPPTPTPPPPTPPPKSTPPPVKQTNPPPQPKLKVHPPKQKSDAKSTTSEQTYVPPPKGNENGVPQGTEATGEPHPEIVSTAPPATPAPTPVPTPTPPPKPACANPNVDANAINKVQPDYPEIARQQGVVGTTTVKVTLSATGTVSAVSVYKSAGNAALDQEALRAARQSTYTPEISNCEKVAGSYLFVAEFDSQ